MPERPLRVLLFSPLPGLDPFTGDVIYSEALVEQPPPGVTYVRYDDAMASGEIIEHGRRHSSRAGDPLGRRALALATTAREHAVNMARDRDLLFREPFRFIEVVGSFDLVHCHTYSVRWSGVPTPVLVSNAVPHSELYARMRHWSANKVRFADTTDRVLARLLGVDHIVYGLSGVDRVVAFTHVLGRLYQDQGVPEERIGVVPLFPSGMPEGTLPASVPGRIGFVAQDFVAKGGDTLLAALPLIQGRRPDAHVVVAGKTPAITESQLATPGVTWRGFLSRAELLADFLPGCQVFAYASRFDGLPLTLLEALGSAVPLVVSDYLGLPEIVADGVSGRVVPQSDPGALADAVVELLDPATNAVASRAARARYESTYSPAHVLPLLRENYDLAIETHQRRHRQSA